MAEAGIQVTAAEAFKVPKVPVAAGSSFPTLSSASPLGVRGEHAADPGAWCLSGGSLSSLGRDPHRPAPPRPRQAAGRGLSGPGGLAQEGLSVGGEDRGKEGFPGQKCRQSAYKEGTGRLVGWSPRASQSWCERALGVGGGLPVYAVLSHFSRVRLCATRGAPLSVGFSGQEDWSGLPCPFQGIFPNQALNPHLLCLLHCQAGPLPLNHQEV